MKNQVFRFLRRVGVLMVVALPLGATEVVPDRPGFSTGTYTVQPGVIQVEMGVQHSRLDDSWVLPLINVRTGLGERTELNVYWDGVSINRDQTAAAPLMVGAKRRLVEADRYNWSVLGYLAVDEGRLLPFIAFLWDRVLTDQMGLFGTFQVQQSFEGGEIQTDFQPALGISFSHTASLSSYLEVYENVSLDTGESAVNIDGGIAWLMRPDVQLDVTFDLPAFDSDEVTWGVGFAKAF